MGTKSHIVRIGCAQAGKAGFGQPVTGVLARGPGFLQPVAEGHKLIYLGDDAVLFGEGREGH